jgi:hypothetical protein
MYFKMKNNVRIKLFARNKIPVRKEFVQVWAGSGEAKYGY